jgi:hypothetical protein
VTDLCVKLDEAAAAASVTAEPASALAKCCADGCVFVEKECNP